MLLFQHATSFLAISQLLFMGLFYLAYYRSQTLGKLIACYTLCVIAYVLARLPELNQGPQAIAYFLSILSSSATALLWIITHQLFIDERRIHPAIWIMIAGHILLRAVGNLLTLRGIPISDLEPWLYFHLPRLVMLVLAVHVVYMAIRGLKADLIKPRRLLRVPFAITMGSVVTIIVGSGFLNLGVPWMSSVYISALFVLTLFFNLATFRLHKESPQLLELPPDGASGRGNSRHADKSLIDRLHAMMESERLYAQQSLTVGMLATRMSMQEYRLRRLIHQKLHFRNFNQYLNHYRITEAARRLQDPAEGHLPISTIAMDVGYASQSTFNKTFKELKGVTPSCYRSKSL